jgi:hypothetical protein
MTTATSRIPSASSSRLRGTVTGFFLVGASLASYVVFPIITLLVGVVVALVGAVGGLSTRSADRSHVYGRTAVLGMAWVAAPTIYLCLVALR